MTHFQFNENRAHFTHDFSEGANENAEPFTRPDVEPVEDADKLRPAIGIFNALRWMLVAFVVFLIFYALARFIAAETVNSIDLSPFTGVPLG